MNKTIKIALVGQPNVGKSMLINSISNSRLKVGNFSGVTVEKKEVIFKYKDYNIKIIDLPGSYSLENYSLEEKVVKNFLNQNEYDIILNVIDSTNLQRNLLLTSELLDLNKKMVIALNMSDEAKKENILINNEKLSSLLNTPCIKTSATKKDGITELLQQIIKTFKEDKTTFKHSFTTHILNHDEILAKRFNFIKNLIQQCVKIEEIKEKTTTEKIDSILMNKFIGLPIFLFLMWGLFQLTFTLGEIPMDYIDTFFSSFIDVIKNIIGDNQLSSLLGDGIIAGVSAVVMFLPNILILFLGISLLEGTGYMSRVAFLLDGTFHKFGLHGKSFIPLVTGFGCSVPAYMAARTLKNERDKLLTLFIIGFMSCGARLPIYVLFVGAFFGYNNAGNILFVIYISGAILGLFAAKFLRAVVFKGKDEPFVMEMPKYRLPSLKLVYKEITNKAFMYLKKAGTFILAASILIWFMSNYPKYPNIEDEINQKIELAINDEVKKELQNELALYNLENSYLGKLGKFSEPFFAPLGFDWKMAVALEAGLAAKEVVVSTLSILYGLGESENPDEPTTTLVEKIKTNIPFEAAISFIVFVMIYLPCLAASMVFTKEAGGWKYLVYLFIFTTTTAWIMSFIAYNITKIVLA
ncbi:ferrous iron transport protein B [Arcobacter cryaerophilus gv. pseudocryaerophilus]|uniref:Ferrous iron transport protein B n=2 Tax=unclassified Arcobacter TaxID=2593671 RepID=A0AA96DBE9_9BACT|nr:ferrous iron transport protein B [Arcobacter sp. AZ-2023]WPD09740.1 ferrous iron transport protein B [Arcobacter sp. DSM 115954]WNL14569.1 ferrous iron transport protein B [Arcobacter sp. AZ-2023]WNL19547.1 ferrous iron transport protein B [Arcobacter sp. AZ-2023]WNL24270.1 ferrous iron transport protein B [Arcobacter sp. AZ-2023]